MIRAGGGALSVKTGAEGAYVAVLSGLGLGVALKIDDGAGRAAETTIAALLVALGLVQPDDPAVAPLAEAPILNTQGRTVGARRPAAWLAPAVRAAFAERGA
jgi:L-asparaginase II